MTVLICLGAWLACFASAQAATPSLHVANLYGESIARLAPTAAGDAAPIGLIAGGNTTLDFPHGVDVDAQGRIYVANQFGNSIAVFGPDADGSVAPVATIAGGATGLSAPQALAVVPRCRACTLNRGQHQRRSPSESRHLLELWRQLRPHAGPGLPAASRA